MLGIGKLGEIKLVRRRIHTYFQAEFPENTIPRTRVHFIRENIENKSFTTTFYNPPNDSTLWTIISSYIQLAEKDPSLETFAQLIGCGTVTLEYPPYPNLPAQLLERLTFEGLYPAAVSFGELSWYSEYEEPEVGVSRTSRTKIFGATRKHYDPKRIFRKLLRRTVQLRCLQRTASQVRPTLHRKCLFRKRSVENPIPIAKHSDLPLPTMRLMKNGFCFQFALFFVKSIHAIFRCAHESVPGVE